MNKVVRDGMYGSIFCAEIMVEKFLGKGRKLFTGYMDSPGSYPLCSAYS